MVSQNCGGKKFRDLQGKKNSEMKSEFFKTQIPNENSNSKAFFKP